MDDLTGELLEAHATWCASGKLFLSDILNIFIMILVPLSLRNRFA